MAAVFLSQDRVEEPPPLPLAGSYVKEYTIAGLRLKVLSVCTLPAHEKTPRTLNWFGFKVLKTRWGLAPDIHSCAEWD